jgi:hypothetical protein
MLFLCRKLLHCFVAGGLAAVRGPFQLTFFDNLLGLFSSI